MSMRAITVLVLLLCGFTIQLHAKSTFVRVYNLQRKLIVKGDLVATTDSSVIIQHRKEQVEIAVTNIGFIKTGRPVAGPIGIGAGVGAVAGLFAGLIGSGDSGTGAYAQLDESLGAATGFALGTAGGAVVGAIITATKKRQRIQVNGDVNAWQQSRQLLNAIIPPAQ
jgi:hypothetical protein